MDKALERTKVEVLIFASDGPAKLGDLKRALPGLTAARLKECVAEINEELTKSDRPYEIVPIAGGFQFRSKLEHAALLREAQPQRKVRLSRAALESLAVIAYRQPLTRTEVDDIRGVDSGAVVKGLLDRGLVRIVGRRDAPGRPVLYGTSARFLEVFGLASLRDLPELRQVLPPEASEGTKLEHALGDPARVELEDESEAGDVDPLEELDELEAAELDLIEADAETGAPSDTPTEDPPEDGPPDDQTTERD